MLRCYDATCLSLLFKIILSQRLSNNLEGSEFFNEKIVQMQLLEN